MMLDYQKVIELLNDIENPIKANTVAENIQIQSEDPRFATLLQHAIKDRKLPDNIKLAGTVVLNKVVAERCSEWEESNLISCLMDIITDETVENRFKEVLEVSLTTVMELSSQHYFSQVLLKAAEIIFLLPKNGQSKSMEHQLYDKTADFLKTALLILRSLLYSNAHFGVLSAAIKQSLLQTSLIIKIGVSAKDLNAVIALAKLWKDVIDKAKEGMSEQHTQLLKWISRNQTLTQWVFQIYSLDHLPGQLCYINPQSSLDHDHLNQLKVAAANLHSSILLGIQRTKQTQVQELTSRHISQVTVIINTICAFSTHRSLCNTYDEFITAIIGVLIIMIKQYGLHFSTIYDRILHIIIFPLLAITEEEELLFAEDPQEFNRLSEDCCDRQSFGIMKTETARLLETICDEVRGTAEYAIQHAIISIQVRLSLVQNIKQSVQHFLTLEEAFFILSILSYRISKHENQLNQLRIMLTVNNMKKATAIELARCFQFLAYNYQQFYPDINQGEQWIYAALNTTIEQAERYPSLAFAALDFISNVIDNYFSQAFTIEYIKKCSVSKNNMQFSIFIKLIGKHYAQFSEEGLCLALDCLLEAVCQDVNRYEQQKKAHTMDINHSLQTVRRIAQKSNFIVNKPHLKNKIWEYVDRLQLFKRANIQDQVIKIVTTILKSDGINQKIIDILPRIIELYKHVNYHETAYIIFINEIALKSSDPAAIGVLYPLLECTERLLDNVHKNPTSVTDNLALASSLLVLQHIVAIFGQTLPKEILGYIVELANKIIPISDEPEDKTEPIVLARALNLFFLCHMYHKDERALKRLLLFQDVKLFRGHDLQVLTTCLVKQIFRETDIVAVTEMINLLIGAICKANEQSAPEVKSKRNPGIKKSATVIRIKKIADYEVCLKTMTQPFDSTLIPELSLKTAINQMKNSNYMLYQSILNSLPTETSQNLRKVMSQVTIQGQKRKIVRVGENRLYPDRPSKMFNNLKRKLQASQDDEQIQEEDDEEPLSQKKAVKKKRKEETNEQ